MEGKNCLQHPIHLTQAGRFETLAEKKKTAIIAGTNSFVQKLSSLYAEKLFCTRQKLKKRCLINHELEEEFFTSHRIIKRHSLRILNNQKIIKLLSN
jgi:sulfur relay (sulfurtransferase) DsrF/TusC family protein